KGAAVNRLACSLLAVVLVSGANASLPEGGPHVVLTDATREGGVDFRHVNVASPDKHLFETMGSGGLFFDYDDDGWIDLFLVDGGSLADARGDSRAKHRLYRNRGHGTLQ